MNYKVFLLCALSSAVCALPQVYEARDVRHIEPVNDAVSRSIDMSMGLMKELSSTLDKVSSGVSGNPSDPNFIQNLVEAFMPLSEMSVEAARSVDGPDLYNSRKERLQAVKDILPRVSDLIGSFQQSSRDMGWPQQPLGQLQMDTDRPANSQATMEAVLTILPEITEAFEQFNSDSASLSPNDPAAMQKLIMGFLPLAKKSLYATARAEGRVVTREELEELERAERLLPSVFQFMNTMGNNDFFGMQPAVASQQPKQPPTSVVSPFFGLQSAVASQQPQQQATPVAASFTPVKAPAFPELQNHGSQVVYQGFIPVVPHGTGLAPTFTYATHYMGR